MGVYKSSVTINSSIEKIFETVSDAENFSKAIPDIIKIEIISDIKKGVGTKFKETRNMNGKEATSTLEVTEYKENEYIRLVSDEKGAVWDSIFRVKKAGNGVELSLEMKARPYKFLARIMTFLIRGILQKALDKDMMTVKEYCEK